MPNTELYIKSEFEFNIKNAEIFNDWLGTVPKGFKLTVMSKDQIIN